ncbi:MAG TPA: nucleotidyltransferase family protein [Bryobacteraceae bacterium]|nr:nucleotidyltransferase family protein [Bryobacteraceae bacterium]
MKTAGIILAAGESKRMGRAKAFLPFRSGTFLSTLAGAFQPFCDPLIAVFGFDGDAAATLAPNGVQAVVNRDYRLGMLTSLQAGLRAVGLDSIDRVFFTLVDHPAVSSATLEALCGSKAKIAIPRFAGKRGHPVLIGREIAREYLAEPQEALVRDVIDRQADRIEYIEVPDPGIHDDVDDPAVYAALLEREAVRL